MRIRTCLSLVSGENQFGGWGRPHAHMVLIPMDRVFLFLDMVNDESAE